MARIGATRTHFVRCVNPNTLKAPDALDGGHVALQLRSAGVGGRGSSRDGACFAAGAARLVRGGRVHAVLNSLSIDFIAVSFASLGEGGAFMPAPEGGAPRYIGVGGMGTIAEQLAGGLNIRQDIWVSPNGGIFTERGSAGDGGGGPRRPSAQSLTRRSAPPHPLTGARRARRTLARSARPWRGGARR